MRAEPSITIGTRIVNASQPCFVIAEIGVNHNGDTAIARQLIDVAIEAGADAVKFQTFRTQDLVVADAPKAAYQSRNTGGGTQASMLASLEFTQSQFVELKAYCDARGIEFISTAFDAQSLADVLELKPSVLKWPSGEIDNHPLLIQGARAQLPIILSTGMAEQGEIAAALGVLDRHGCPQVAVLQCVSQYPAPMAEQNLTTIATMREQFGRVTGFSDHTVGPWAAIAARGLGMAILEKHITLDRAMPGPDHAASMEPQEFRQMIGALREVEAALGDGDKRPMPSEFSTRQIARKSIVYACELAAGTVIAAHHLTAKRPGGGISPARLEDIVGRTLQRSVVADEQVVTTDLA